MPVMDGFQVLHEMNNSGIIKTIPVILITSEEGDEKTLLGYKLEVSDFIKKPFNPDIVYRRVTNVIELYSNKRILEEKLKEQKEKLESQARRLKRANQSVIDILSTTVEFRDSESGEHIKRIRVLTYLLLEKLSAYYPLSHEEIEIIGNASAVHDIGKITIPDSILLKPGPLTPEEFAIMKTHTTQGCKILSSLPPQIQQDDTFFKYCYDICRSHHERWDGRGYPDGLKGEDIPIWAQATSLADVLDALTSKRVYKEAYSFDEAVKMIQDGKCGAFNPKLLECLISIKDILFEQINSSHH